MKTINIFAIFSVILSGCVTPEIPKGPRVKDGTRVYYPSQSQSLTQGVPFIQPSNSMNSNVNFPEASGDPPNNNNISPEIPATEPKNGNIPPNSIPEKTIPITTSQAQNTSNTISPQIAPVSGSAVNTLLADAKKAVNENRLDRASSSLERALRIEPNNASLWYDLAQIKLHQRDYVGSENYAKKSIGLAGEGSDIAQKNYSLLAAGREEQGDKIGAAEANKRAK